ncbi:hypothetical protein [Legionella jordanis]|uniref:Uncharacterized protein n=1 Tax=Legionella jordanis TaxID=456 RepID=A0A0W0VDC6_9GAMM|nr:hypothetical protein [Legionella jordanis]KTD18095.1 hypothetical protein Ljor_2401 [Legionella jordanis]RMX00592.1 hypothetical protein EAW55_12590 [Legionella jordanis]RMX21292.1 hypothetical protein EAS68_03735 [Legionella jordanis]VEH13813.1 Uncharacterised protein [Legionella jordanis]
MRNLDVIPFQLPINQNWLLELLKRLGYEPGNGGQIGDKEHQGFCYGIAHAVIPAAILEALTITKIRFNLMYILSEKLNNNAAFFGEEPFQLKILFPKIDFGFEFEQYFNEQILTNPELVKSMRQQPQYNCLNDIHAFCDAIVLYQFRSLKQLVLEDTSNWNLIPMLMPPALTSLGGIEKPVEAFHANLRANSMADYLYSLDYNLSAPTPFEDPVVLVLTSYNGTCPWHTVTVVFQQNNWLLIDANNLNLMNQPMSCEKEMAKQLWISLIESVGLAKDGSFTILTEVYAAGIYREQLNKRLAEWAKNPILPLISVEMFKDYIESNKILLSVPSRDDHSYTNNSSEGSKPGEKLYSYESLENFLLDKRLQSPEALDIVDPGLESTENFLDGEPVYFVTLSPIDYPIPDVWQGDLDAQLVQSDYGDLNLERHHIGPLDPIVQQTNQNLTLEHESSMDMQFFEDTLERELLQDVDEDLISRNRSGKRKSYENSELSLRKKGCFASKLQFFSSAGSNGFFEDLEMDERLNFDHEI